MRLEDGLGVMEQARILLCVLRILQLRLDFTRIANIKTHSALDAWSSYSNYGQAI